MSSSNEELIAYLRKLTPQVDLTVGEQPPEPPDYRILIAGRPTETLLDASPRLETLLIPYAGLPKSTGELLSNRPHLRVHNIHHNAAAAAELAMALLLSAAKCIVPLDRSLRAGDWTPRYEPNQSVLLGGGRALILGFGAIGSKIARGCLGLGMEVTAIRRRPQQAPGLPEDVQILGPDQLHEALKQTDALFGALPLTPKTENLIGEEELRLLPANAVVVNVGRGPVINQKALFESLHTRAIRAAGLDVWYNYPREVEARTNTPPADFPFGQLDNVVLSPHRGGALGVDASERLRMEALADTLNCAARGEALPHPVDVAEGY